ncbi:sigma-70 family RNA polymerase sigma factor [Sorangium sp. KYC3313]|uniref:RNA polymerase sigma factor n=1 Tax=Sorangium sp. KYC3313 TaxID=3449740 RepID=UPI003F8B325F
MAEHLETVRRYVERQGFHGADRDDLVQEIFHGASRSLPRYDPRIATVRTWLLRIAFNLTSNERNRAHRRHEELWPEEALEGLSSRAPDSETRLIEAEQSDILADLLQEVPPRRRAILVAHDLQEEAVQDIAEELAMPRNTVWNDLRLARLSLDAAARRWQARRRGRGALIAPLAFAFGATEARASSGPLQGGRLRRLLDRARRAFRRAPSHGVARPAASSWNTSLAPTHAVRRSTASTAAGVVAGALALLAPGGRGEIPPPSAHAVALRSPQAAWPAQPSAHAVALRSPQAAWPAQRDSAVPAGPEVPSEERAQGEVSGALTTARRDPPRPRYPPGPRRGEGIQLPSSEARLIRQAFAALAAGRHDAVRLLLERHRRDFPRGAYARDREELMRRLQAKPRRN